MQGAAGTLQKEGFRVVDGVACRVNGVAICLSDLTQPRIDKNGRPLTRQEAIEEELSVQHAAQLKVQPTDLDIERQIVKLKERNNITHLSDLEFEEWVSSTSAGLTLKAVKRQFYRIGAAMKAKESCIIDASVVTEEEKKRYFASTSFKSYKLSTCFLSEDEVDEKGNLKKGVSPAWNSINAYIKESKLSDEMLPVVKELAVGKVSRPVLTRHGYQLIRLDDTKTLSYNEAKVAVERKLLKQKQKKAERNLIQKLTDEAVILLYPLSEK